VGVDLAAWGHHCGLTRTRTASDCGSSRSRPAAVAVLAFTHARIFQYEIHFNFDLDWDTLIGSYFVLGNWHLLWYGVLGAAVLAGRRIFAARLAPMTAIVVAGLSFLVFVLGFTSARDWSSEQTTVNRATLHLAPLMVVFAVMAFREFSGRWSEGWRENLVRADTAAMRR
jgi:hypothetical protein